MSIEKSLSFADYQKRPGINSSILRTVDRMSESHAKAEMDGLRGHETDAMDFGTAFHSLVLEGRKDYVVRPDTYTDDKGVVKDWHHASKTCKKWLADHAGSIVLDKWESARLEGMAEKVGACDELYSLLKGSECELSLFAEKDGVALKARLDVLTPAGPVPDFKTTTNANPETYVQECIRRGYHLQAAWNLDLLRKNGIARDEFWIIGIEKDPPYAHCIIKFKDEPMSFLRVGRRRCNAAFQRLKTARETGVWPGYRTVYAEEYMKPWQMAEVEMTA